jgi:hypothetical protein
VTFDDKPDDLLVALLGEAATRELPNTLQQYGWSRFPYDTCWMACDGIGYRKEHGKREVVLCKKHIRELERTAQEHGYSHCDPPSTGGVRVWIDNDALGAPVYEMWWPWDLLPAYQPKEQHELAV